MSKLRQARWETPISDAPRPRLIALTQGEGLHIDVDSGGDAAQRVRFSFGTVPSYRSTREEYRTGAARPGEGLGQTRIIKMSAWIKELREREPLLDAFDPDCEHYVIATEDDCIEVMASSPPKIEIVPGS